MHAFLPLHSAINNENTLLHIIIMYAMALSSEIDAEETLPASRVVSSQIPDYDGGEVDTNETVEIIFPLIVRNYVSVAFLSKAIPYNYYVTCSNHMVATCILRS